QHFWRSHYIIKTLDLLMSNTSPARAHFHYCQSPPSQTYTLSLHDALPISLFSELPNALPRHKKPDTLCLPYLILAAKKRRYRLRSEEHTSELQSLRHLVCRLLLEKKNILKCVRYHSEEKLPLSG